MNFETFARNNYPFLVVITLICGVGLILVAILGIIRNGKFTVIEEDDEYEDEYEEDAPELVSADGEFYSVKKDTGTIEISVHDNHTVKPYIDLSMRHARWSSTYTMNRDAARELVDRLNRAIVSIDTMDWSVNPEPEERKEAEPVTD